MVELGNERDVQVKRALVVGGGSIGLRHSNILQSLGLEVAHVSQRSDLGLQTFNNTEEALRHSAFDYVVVANETSKHESTLSELQGFRGKILVEKPLSVSEELIKRFSPDQIQVAFNLRFHPGLLWLKRELLDQTVLSVECYVGQDLASWRPGRPVSEQYSAHKSQLGGVLRDLSHELDYLVWLFGDWVRVAALGGRIADVTVDSDDSWAVVSQFARAKQVSLQMNYHDKQSRRLLIVNTLSNTFTLDLVNFTATDGKSSLKLDGSGADTYVEMHKAILGGQSGSLCSAQEAIETDKLIASIDKASEDRVWISK